MNQDRKKQIIDSLNGLGTAQNIMYTNQEIIDHLTELQGAMAQAVFEKTHAENLRDRDMLLHFEAFAKEYGLDETDTFLRFKANMNELGYTIGSFIKGMNGERIAKRSLKLLSLDKSIRILYNVQLEDEDAQAEYDAIVIATYGLFVVEVKNWGTTVTISSRGLLTRNDDENVVYDLPGRMSVKEALLRGCLQELFPEEYHNMLLLPNERVRVEDNYHQISVSCGGGISYEIKSFAKQGHILTTDQVKKIADTILANHKEQRSFCSVKCDEIIRDFADLMAQIEDASCGSIGEGEKATDPKEQACKAKKIKLPWYKRLDWGEVIPSIIAITVPAVIMTLAKHKK